MIRVTVYSKLHNNLLVMLHAKFVYSALGEHQYKPYETITLRPSSLSPTLIIHVHEICLIQEYPL